MGSYSVHGRFQVFHNGHLRYFEKAIAHCGSKGALFIVGITQSQETLVSSSDHPRHRSILYNNPLTYEQRCDMIEQVLKNELGLKPTEYTFCKFPIDDDFARLSDYIELQTVMATGVCDEWNLLKIKKLTEHGYQNICVVENLFNQERISGKVVRELIRKKDPKWHSLVPASVKEYLYNTNLVDRL